MATDTERSELLRVRREKLEILRQKGIDPFGGKFVRTHHAQGILEAYGGLTKEELEAREPEVVIAGRLMAKRGHGKAGFGHVQDRTGRIQIYVKLDDVGDETFSLFEMCDIGDIVGVKGTVFKTNRGETTVRAREFVLLTKSLRPLPEKFHGLKDIEEIGRAHV